MSSYQVRIWDLGTRTIRGKKWYRLRWTVDAEKFEKLYKTKALGDAARSVLVKAARAGEPFDPKTGRPVAEGRQQDQTTWYAHARAYIEMKWPRLAAKSRRGAVESLVSTTLVLVDQSRGRPADDAIRQALYLYAFNPKRWADGVPVEHVDALAWIERASLPVAELDNLAQVRRVLDAFCVKLDGKPAAASTVLRKRATFTNTLGYAVELGLLDSNPVDRVQWKAPEVAQAVDRRVVANPTQVAALLAAVGDQGKRAQRVVAFFGCIYYAGARPAEAADLRITDCDLPEEGWGRLTWAETDPHAGSHWTDDGRPNQRRGLKHRARTETRTVPIRPSSSRCSAITCGVSALPRTGGCSGASTAARCPPRCTTGGGSSPEPRR
ncbi:hypothetical protein ACFQX7_30205 [Luedemannella flava]